MATTNANTALPSLSKSSIESTAEHLSTSTAPVTNSWSSPGPAACDFRSDVVTTPTTSMLNAIAATTLLDDVFVEDPTTNSLESFVADLTGKPAALLVLSGTMGNQLALRTALGAPPHMILTDHRSHILEWEAGGAASMCGALVKGVVPADGHHLTLADVKKNAVIDDDVHSCPTRLISLENTLAGTIQPLSDCQAIAEWAHAQDPPIHMHLDGARLWEAVVAGAGSLKEYCACFDSISLCFSKGLGAPIGSMIVGEPAFIKRARWVRKSIGGGLRQAGVVAAPARVAVEETFLGGRLAASHDKAKRIAGNWEALGGKLQFPTETNMVWLDLDEAGISKEEWSRTAAEYGLRLMRGRLVVHYQILDEGIEKLSKVMEAVLKGKRTPKSHGKVNRRDAAELEINVE